MPPMKVMLRKKRLELETRQLNLNERDLDNNYALGLKSLELNAQAHSEENRFTLHTLKWRYAFWLFISILVSIATVIALFLGKEAFALEVIKYAAIFFGGYGAKAAVELRKKTARLPDVEE